jgi:hypothetical protein
MALSRGWQCSFDSLNDSGKALKRVQRKSLRMNYFPKRTVEILACLFNPGINPKIGRQLQWHYKEEVAVVETLLNRGPVSFFVTKEMVDLT